MKLTRITRLLHLLGILQGGKNYNITGLAQACRVSRRTIFRDLDVLRDAGVPLVYDGEFQRYHLNGKHFLPPTDFTPEEALALMVLCYELGDDCRLPFYAPARAAALKLESCLPHRLREHLREVAGAVEIRLDPNNPLAESGTVYRQLVEAIRSRRSVRIKYQSFAERELITTRLNPYRLLFSRRSWYCVGRSSMHRGARTFNLGRIVSLKQLENRYTIPTGFSLERYLGNAWHLIPEPGPDREVWIRFDPLVAANVAEVSWHRTQRCEFRGDGSLDFRVTVSGLQEMAWWVLGYGDQAEVIEPVEMRELIHQRAKRMLGRYDGNATSKLLSNV